jgi:hypothetical protein
MNILIIYILISNFLCFDSFKIIGKLPVLKFGLRESSNDNDVIIEVFAKKKLDECISNENSKFNVVSSYDGVYKEYKEEKIEKVMDSKIGQAMGILFSPTTLLLAMYVATNFASWTQKTWVQRLFSVFGRGGSSKNDKAIKPKVEDLPFQTFECEVCKMEMRPARGRAEIIFGKKSFRCSRCGAKADAYFDVDDMNDPRAVARLERLKKEKEARDKYGEDDEEETEGTDDEE